MSLIRIAFAIVVGVLVCALFEWLTSVPHDIDVLLGIVAAFIAYVSYPRLGL
jgi:hypothetical protein